MNTYKKKKNIYKIKIKYNEENEFPIFFQQK